jgi:hypothetical protein
MIVGEGGIEIRAVPRHAFLHRAPKSLERPAAEAHLTVGCYVGRIDDAEGRVDRPAARKGLAAVGSMTFGAAADLGQFGAASNGFVREAL